MRRSGRRYRRRYFDAVERFVVFAVCASGFAGLRCPRIRARRFARPADPSQVWRRARSSVRGSPGRGLGAGKDSRSRRDAEVNITTDLTFDVLVTPADDELEEERGAVIIRNHDGNYEDEREPARRRKLVIASGGTDQNGEQWLRRSSDDLLLFREPQGGDDLFAGTDRVSLRHVEYWVQGGAG